MNLTKNQIYIISSIVILVVAYYLFFRKKPVKMMAAKTPQTPPATPSESGWAGQWDYTPEMEMDALSGTFDPYAMPGESGYSNLIGCGKAACEGYVMSGNKCCYRDQQPKETISNYATKVAGFASNYSGSQIDAGIIESGYDGIAAAQVPPASSVRSLGTDWLARPKSSDFVQQNMGNKNEESNLWYSSTENGKDYCRWYDKNGNNTVTYERPCTAVQANMKGGGLPA